MAERTSSSIEQNLRFGIEAARTGKDKAAKGYLLAVLKQDPDNIPAMLWLAFVLPDPHDTIRVLERVLRLDPYNERATAGIRWAQAQLEESTDDGQVESEPAADLGLEPEDEAASAPSDIRKQFLSAKLQKQAKKGVLAHRARRTIRPLIAIILVTGIVGLISILLGALLFVPPDTLAAWLPGPVAGVPPSSQTIPVVPVPSMAAPEGNEIETFASQSDSLPLPAPSIPAVAIEPAPIPETLRSPASGQGAPALAQTGLTSLEPSAFVGPELPLNPDDLQVPVMVDNLLLAHQPAYPGEKWIEVNLTTQQVIAWEGDQPVFSFLTSTGLPNTPTVEGKFHIYWKLESTLMTGPGYYLPDVPYTMYFYGGYALHGTYWHNNFGQPMSHGCVNLETGNAQKLFEWADPVIPPGQTQVVAGADNPGTLVVVHY